MYGQGSSEAGPMFPTFRQFTSLSATNMPKDTRDVRYRITNRRTVFEPQGRTFLFLCVGKVLLR